MDFRGKKQLFYANPLKIKKLVVYLQPAKSMRSI